MYWNVEDGDENRLGMSVKPINIRTVSDLNRLIINRLSNFQHVNLIVGVPRSGLMAATSLALYLNVPLVDLSAFEAQNLLQLYTRRKGVKHDALEQATLGLLNVLVVDDATSNGVTIQALQRNFNNLGLHAKFNIEFFSAFVSPAGAQYVDYFLEEVELPRVFEWNLMHHENSRRYCVDLDGILCDDPTPEQNDDGPNYENFCLTARPKILPTMPLGAIVTARLERYRSQTEAWLNRYQIKYDRLIMCNLASGAERRRLSAHAVMKASVYQKLGGLLFVESELAQAREIYAQTNRPVFCLGYGVIVGNERMRGEYVQKIELLESKLIVREKEVNDIRSSTSWRLTGPIRSLISLFRCVSK